MNTNIYASEALKFLEGKEEKFPMICQCLKAGAPIARAMTGNYKSIGTELALEVIWAGSKDRDNNQIVCQLTAPEEGVVKSYHAQVVDKDGKTVAETSFVSFSRNIAFAVLTVPKTDFAQCSVQMSTASISKASCAAQTSELISLKQFYTENLNICPSITAPDFTRENHGEEIRVSYYDSTTVRNSYDYVYPGKKEDQLYFPSSGSFKVEGVELNSENPTMQLTITDGAKNAVSPDERDVTFHVSDSDISYHVNDKWRDRSLKDCFELNVPRSEAHIEYNLNIQVRRKKNGEIISILVTNSNNITDYVQNPRVFTIPRIYVYYDCFAEGMQISMADGTTKLIEDIRQGDMVRTKSGEASRVREVSAQEECQVLNLIMRSGRELTVTGGHAVYTKEGVYPASRLKVGMEILTQNGVDILDEILPCCEGGYRVYSLILEGGEKQLFANGVVVHDSDSGDLFKDRDWVREDLPEEWLLDYDNALREGIIYECR